MRPCAHAPFLADVDHKRVRAHHEALQQQLRRAVANQTVTLHLAEAQTAVAGAALGRLPGEHGAGAARAGVHFVHNHVLELLVVDGAKVHVRLEWLTCHAARQVLFAAVVVAVLHKHARHVVHVRSAERRAVFLRAAQNTSLAGHELNHLADGHARWEAVWIHNNVGTNTRIIERHVCLRHNQAHHTFLAVARRELVAQLRAPRLPNQRLDESLV